MPLVRSVYRGEPRNCSMRAAILSPSSSSSASVMCTGVGAGIMSRSSTSACASNTVRNTFHSSFIPGRALRSAQQRRELINHLTVLGVGTRDWFAGRGKGRVVQVILDAEVNVQLDEHLVEKDMALFAIHRRLADFAAQSFKHGVVAL